MLLEMTYKTELMQIVHVVIFIGFIYPNCKFDLVKRCLVGVYGQTVSLWMLWGLYGSQEVEMGMYYSRVLQSKSLFVKEIKVMNIF